MHTCHFSILKAEAGRSRVQGQAGHHSEALSEQMKIMKRIIPENYLILSMDWFKIYSYVIEIRETFNCVAPDTFSGSQRYVY